MTSRRAHAGMFAVALFGALGCHNRPAQSFDPAVLASVNGETLSREDFKRDLSREIASDQEDGPPTPEQVEPIKKALFDTLVERTLLLQAAHTANVTVAPADVDREVMRISSDFPAEGFNQALTEGKLSVNDLKQRTQNLLVIQKLFEEHVYPRVAVTEEEIRASFEAHEKDFQVPEEVHAQQIVVKTLDEAKHLQTQLKAGKKFADLARKYSLSADAKVGGDLGFFPRGVMPPPFDEVAFKLPVGQTSDVVTTDYGFHLFKVLDKRPARRKDLAQVRTELEKKLLAHKREQAQSEYVKALKDKASLQVNGPALQAVTAEVLHPVNGADAK